MPEESNTMAVLWDADQKQLLATLVTQHMFDFDAAAQELQGFLPSDIAAQYSATVCRKQFAAQYREDGGDGATTMTCNNHDPADQLPQNAENNSDTEPETGREECPGETASEGKQKKKKKKKKKKKGQHQSNCTDVVKTNQENEEVEEESLHQQDTLAQKQALKRQEIQKRVDIAKQAQDTTSKVEREEEEALAARMRCLAAQKATQDIKKEMDKERSERSKQTAEWKQKLAKQREEDKAALTRLQETQKQAKKEQVTILAQMTPEQRERYQRVQDSLRLYRQQRSNRALASGGAAEEQLMAIANRFAHEASNGFTEDDTELCEFEALMPSYAESGRKEAMNSSPCTKIIQEQPKVETKLSNSGATDQKLLVVQQDKCKSGTVGGRFDFDEELRRMIESDDSDDYEFRFCDPEKQADFKGFDALFADLEQRDRKNQEQEQKAAMDLLAHYEEVSMVEKGQAARPAVATKVDATKKGTAQALATTANGNTPKEMPVGLEVKDNMSFAEMMAVIDAREEYHKQRRNKVFEDVLASLGGDVLNEDIPLPPSIMNLLPKK